MLGESITDFTLSGLLEAPAFTYINTDITFSNAIDKIWIPITEVILCSAIGDLNISNKQREWVVINTILLLLFLIRLPSLTAKCQRLTFSKFLPIASLQRERRRKKKSRRGKERMNPIAKERRRKQIEKIIK